MMTSELAQEIFNSGFYAVMTAWMIGVGVGLVVSVIKMALWR